LAIVSPGETGHSFAGENDGVMSPERLRALLGIYRDGLLNDTLPFWIPRAIDRECGGYLTALDRDGSLLQTDKPVWVHGRFAWLLATLFNTVEPRIEWLDLAAHGIDFINRYCFDADGRMFFSVTRDGRPLRKRRYLFSEAFTILALSAFGTAAGDARSKQQALELFRLVLRYHDQPGLLEPKVISATRRLKGLAMPMILIVTAQELRKATADPLCSEIIDRSIAEIEHDFLHRDLQCVLETVGPDGEFYDTFDGRMVCPGHAIEAAWFILEEARCRGNDARLIELGTTIIDWSLEMGWDDRYGGLVYFTDARGLPATEYAHDMKLWWPHN
jgi:N-acylglucosamine 2-epimerase